MAAKRLREAGFADASTRKLAELKRGGIAVRRLPYTVIDSYFDGTRCLAYPIQVVVAREGELQAIDECCAIADLLPMADLRSENGTYRITSCEVYTEPQELEMEGYPAVWECRLRAFIETSAY